MRLSGIPWTGPTWNYLKGCTRCSPGCLHCYAERQAIRHAGPGGAYEGLVQITNGHPQWTGVIGYAENRLEEPLRWKKPEMIFVNSMSDMFHESVSFETIDKMVYVMARADWHIFQVLTKRTERMVEWCFSSDARTDLVTRLKHIHWGTSVENQDYANSRIPHLIRMPAMTWLSIEPQLGAITLRRWMHHTFNRRPILHGAYADRGNPAIVAACDDCGCSKSDPIHHPSFESPIRWMVVGGESGPGARPFHLSWATILLAEGIEGRIPTFIKQLGANPFFNCEEFPTGDRKGETMEEWPALLQVREWPVESQGWLEANRPAPLLQEAR